MDMMKENMYDVKNMKNKITALKIPVLIILFCSVTAYAQDAGRRYTFIAKDGSQIINVLLVHEKEDSYTVKIGHDNQEIVIQKKNIEKLVMTDSEKKIDYRPVLGKKSEPKKGADINQPAGERKENPETDFTKIRLAAAVYKISTSGKDSLINAQGWGGELLPTMGIRQMDFIQLGAGFSYSRMDSSVQDKASNLSMTGIFGYLQLSHAPGFLSFEALTVRPFLGAAFGGALTYTYAKPVIIQSGNEDGNKSAAGMKNFSLDTFYGFRGGIGISSLKYIPLEVLLGYQYSIILDNKIKNFMFYSAGVNFHF